MLAEELRAMGIKDAEADGKGIVMGTVPATAGVKAPAIAWVAHVDTSPETSGRDVKPQVHRNYDGKDITLPGDPSRVIRVADNPELNELHGKTIITTDGTTLLGADDKAGVAVIMEAAAYLMAHPEVPHGPVRVCFTCDEEIGHGVDHVDLKKLGAVCAYTLDGSGQGELDVETFSADLALVTVSGVNIHPSIGKGRMVNAVRLAGMFLDRLPQRVLSPETTDGRDGFLHPYKIEGGVAEVTIRILLRDFDAAKLAEGRAAARRRPADRGQYPQARVNVNVTPQYRNMADGRKGAAARVRGRRYARAVCSRKPPSSAAAPALQLTEMGLPRPISPRASTTRIRRWNGPASKEMETAVRSGAGGVWAAR